MLIYHPIEDSNHCCYRLIRLLDAISAESVPLHTLMICDFYSLFPGQLKNIIGWPRANSASWRTIQSIPDEYEEMLNQKRVFFKLNSIQNSAIAHLHSKEIISFSSPLDGNIALNRHTVPSGIRERLTIDPVNQSNWFALITKELTKIELYGKMGLKSKTGLMEFVYD